MGFEEYLNKDKAIQEEVKKEHYPNLSSRQNAFLNILETDLGYKIGGDFSKKPDFSESSKDGFVGPLGMVVLAVELFVDKFPDQKFFEEKFDNMTAEEVRDATVQDYLNMLA